MSMTPEQFAKAMKSEFKEEIISKGTDLPRIERFSSSSLALDIALGGGWPRGRVMLIHGPESSGKTTLCTLAMHETQRRCTDCFEPYNAEGLCPNKCKGGRGTTLYADTEGTFDPVYAGKCGVTTDLMSVSRGATGEQTVHSMVRALEEGVFNMYVLDSVEHCRPAVEIEGDVDKSNIGTHAKFMNQACRKFTHLFANQIERRPAMFLINQTREKVGVMFGNPETLPGGKGQLFAASIRVGLKTPKVHEVDGEKTYVEISGTVFKNKTWVPRVEFAFRLYFRDHEYHQAGRVDNVDAILKHATQLGLITSGGGNYKYVNPLSGEEIAVKGKSTFAELLVGDPELYSLMYEQVLQTRLSA